MKTTLNLTLILFFGILILSCQPKVEKVEFQPEKIDLINDEFPEAKKEIMEVMEELKQTIKEGNIDKLISGHAYGPKFTEFKQGKRRNDAIENEKHERGFFSKVTEVKQMEFDDLKIAVFDRVANVTYHANMEVMLGEQKVKVNNQVTLLFVKSETGWKCVHEHHSPLNKESS